MAKGRQPQLLRARHPGFSAAALTCCGHQRAWQEPSLSLLAAAAVERSVQLSLCELRSVGTGEGAAEQFPHPPCLLSLIKGSAG